MEMKVLSLDAVETGVIELPDRIFGVPVRRDILHRVVVWQLAARRSGTRRTKTYGDVRATTAKLYRQKGMGRARHGSRAAPQFRGGGKAMGPVTRSHATGLQKKVRALGLRCALSAKYRDGRLVILEHAALPEISTGRLAARLAVLGLSGRSLIIDGREIDRNMSLSARNLQGVMVMPSAGANVHDILRCDRLALTRAAVAELGGRLP